MSLHAIKNSTPNSADPQAVPHIVLENLAMRMRPGGLCLMLLRPDGQLAFGDSSAGMFFQRYVMPLLQYGDEDRQAMRDRIEKLSTGAGTAIWQIMPGVILSAFPYIEKRQVAGAVVLAGKSGAFRLGEEVVRVCGRLGLDGIWLNQQAEELPCYNEETITRQSRLLLSMMRDQLRLNGLEQELDSLSGQLANTYEELSLIYQISGGMKVNRQASDFFKQACLDVLEVMGVRGMGVALQGSTLRRQEPVIYGSVSLAPGKVHRLADQLLADLTERKSALLINNLPADKSLSWMGEYATQILAVPLQRQEQVLGCLFAMDKSTGEFDSMDSKLLNSIANESAIYLENSMLFEDVHDLMMGLLHSLTSAVDAKDAYTCGHSERVALLSRHLARQIQLPEVEIERIYMAGLLHDVGKIGVPENVLQKTGRLTAEEFEQMKRHPQIGARILRDIKQIEDIIPGVLHHHERYDGRGYPAGLAGERIPLMGRIICLADCFDAMTSNRTYRKALPLEVALTEIRRCSGTQFDPRLTESFLQVGAERYRELLREQEQKSRMLMDLQESLRAA
ncbi:MAG: HD domain-containing protein [Phycisphaerales bacterium]|jgi:putative nucleotidyltransferase with HDIG domain|nr:HD domain-containing protein [Phycisphaerales bacterium]